jgi:hypothetical protein
MGTSGDSFAMSCPDGTEESLRELSNGIISLVGKSRSEYRQYRDNLQDLVNYMSERLGDETWPELKNQ